MKGRGIRLFSMATLFLFLGFALAAYIAISALINSSSGVKLASYDITYDSIITCPDGLAYGRFLVKNTSRWRIELKCFVYDPGEWFMYYRDGREATTFIGKDECPPGNPVLGPHQSAYVAFPLIVPNPGPAALKCSACVVDEGGGCNGPHPIKFAIDEQELTSLGIEPVYFHETQTSFEVSDVSAKMGIDGITPLTVTLHNTGSNILWLMETTVIATADDSIIVALDPDNIGNQHLGTLFPGESVQHQIDLDSVEVGETYEVRFTMVASNNLQWRTQRVVSFTVGDP